MQAHNTLFGLQGVIFAALAVSHDLPSIMNNVQTALPVLLPMFAGFIKLGHSTVQDAKTGFKQGQGASLSDTQNAIIELAQNMKTMTDSLKTLTDVVQKNL